MGKRNPCSEKELLEDRGEMKQIRPSVLTVVMSGISDIVALTKQTRETDYSMTAALETAAKMRKYILWLKYVYPGVKLVLISPPAIFIDNQYVRGEVTSLSTLYREMASLRSRAKGILLRISPLSAKNSTWAPRPTSSRETGTTNPKLSYGLRM